jgi:hypothetical protein
VVIPTPIPLSVGYNAGGDVRWGQRLSSCLFIVEVDWSDRS